MLGLITTTVFHLTNILRVSQSRALTAIVCTLSSAIFSFFKIFNPAKDMYCALISTKVNYGGSTLLNVHNGQLIDPLRLAFQGSVNLTHRDTPESIIYINTHSFKSSMQTCCLVSTVSGNPVPETPQPVTAYPAQGFGPLCDRLLRRLHLWEMRRFLDIGHSNVHSMKYDIWRIRLAIGDILSQCIDVWNFQNTV